jgi:hypothetical protein
MNCTRFWQGMEKGGGEMMMNFAEFFVKNEKEENVGDKE